MAHPEAMPMTPRKQVKRTAAASLATEPRPLEVGDVITMLERASALAKLKSAAMKERL